ncbi:MAG TPA: dihydropteroate synthase [Nitrososphaera sp.]|nr:dihydropteroate synthase [Nitrososphaera sp.]
MLKIGDVKIGEGGRTKLVPKVLGIINASPESFYKASVRTSDREIAAAARQLQLDGAHIIDIGAMSTAPYLETVIPVEEEVRRMKMAVKAVKRACDLPVTADTPRAAVAKEAIAAGADAINDVTGLKHDRRMADVAAGAGVPVIIGAYSKAPATGRLAGTIKALKESLAIARGAGIKKVIVDPSIGFFRKEGKHPFFTRMTDVPWYIRDIEVLNNLKKISSLGPVCVSVSRKSFIGHLFGIKGDERLVPSIVCEMVAVMNGAGVIRTHSVRETVHALTMLQLLNVRHNTKRL